MTKEKLDLVFHVEMDPEDAEVLIHHLNRVRHELNKLEKWDISRDMPNIEIRRKNGEAIL